MYYIIEHQVRPDGITNTSETGRSSFALALSYYYDRMSKMCVNDTFVSVHFLLVDEKLGIYKHDDVTTLYKPAPAQEETAETAEAAE